MTVRIYEYKNCNTCKMALKFLDANGVSYEKLPIVDQPPTAAELKKMLGYLKKSGKTLTNLFNTSGEVYRSLKVSERLKAGMSEEEALSLLAKNGKLIKRPFLLTPSNGTTGFQADLWKTLL